MDGEIDCEEVEGVIAIRCDVNGGSWYKFLCMAYLRSDRVVDSGTRLVCRACRQFSEKLDEDWEYFAIKSWDDLNKNLCH